MHCGLRGFYMIVTLVIATQVMKRGDFVFRFLAEQKKLSQRHIQLLWSAISRNHGSDTAIDLYKVCTIP